MSDVPLPATGDRLAKVIARSGLCSRRDAEAWIKDGRISVNGKVVKTPAFNVTDKDEVKVDGQPLAARQGTRVWLYHKPTGLVVTEKDPEGRPTIFEKLEEHGLPRVVTIGRLDINTEGLLLLTNDGGLKRVLELPATGWLRKYRVRAFGSITQAQLDQLKQGMEIEGVKYGPIDAVLEREQGANVWLQVSLREGKNREVKNVLAALGLQVNRLIRISYGPFQLGDLPIGAVETVRARVLRDQLGKRLADEAGVDFESELPEEAQARHRAVNPKLRVAAPGKPQPRQGRGAASAALEQFRFTDRAEKSSTGRKDEDRPRQDRPGRGSTRPAPPARRPVRDEEQEQPARRVHFEDGREPAEFRPKAVGRKPAEEGAAAGGRPRRSAPGERPPRSGGERPPRTGGERPPRTGSERPPRSGGERPPRSGGERQYDSERPKRFSADRPRRDEGDRPSGRPPRRDGAFSSKPRSPRADAGGERPPRSFGKGPRPEGGTDRPKRRFDDRPGGDREQRPRTPRPATGAPRPPRPRADGPPAARADRTRSEARPRSRPTPDAPGRGPARPRSRSTPDAPGRGPTRPPSRPTPPGKPRPPRGRS